MTLSKIYMQSCAFAFFAVGVLTLAAPAQAGFEFTPPAVTAPQPGPAGVADMPANTGPLTPEPDSLPVAGVPVENVDSDSLPVVADDGKQAVGMKTIPARPAPVAEPATPEPVEEVTMSTAPVPAPAPVSQPDQQQAPFETTPIQGFGSDMPLAMALRDIVPARYAFAFENSSIAATKISWQGGKAWLQVLDDALMPSGLSAHIEGNVVRIGYGQTAAHNTTLGNDAPSESPQPAAMAEPAPQSYPARNKPLNLTNETEPAEPATAPAPVTASVSAKDMMVDLNRPSRWQARPGSTLRQVLDNWSQTAHVDLQWLTPYDYPINNTFVYEGTFNEAVSSLLSSYSRENPRPRGRLYPNAPDGPSVLMVN